MSVSILEVLMNAQINFENVARMNAAVSRHPMFMLATEQLKNGIAALEAGQSPDDTYTEPKD